MPAGAIAGIATAGTVTVASALTIALLSVGCLTTAFIASLMAILAFFMYRRRLNKKATQVVHTDVVAEDDDSKGGKKVKIDEECSRAVVTERPNESQDNMLKPDTTQYTDPFKNEVKTDLNTGRLA